MKTFLLVALGIFTLASSVRAASSQLADWTFETNPPTTAGPYAADSGSGNASASHASSSTSYTNPQGNGSNESYSADHWVIGDYFQFQTSSLGYNNIDLSFDQLSSATGPLNFEVLYSTDNITYLATGDTYTVNNSSVSADNWTSTPKSVDHYDFDLTSISALNNAATIYFRLQDTSTTSASGFTVGTAGTDRVDNVIIAADALPAAPVPDALWASLALLPLVTLRKFLSARMPA
ncbi:MAG TPA: hypothetical protein VH253_14395 [Phycisphaerae bacterium]|nr:hypothetical protein [Phycisphaerae bacterium]